jgi:hypothetical protein
MHDGLSDDASCRAIPPSRHPAIAACRRYPAGMTEGTPTRPTPPTPTSRYLRTAPEGVVLPGSLCIGCGYDIRGVPADADCTECGRPIADTLRHAAGGHAIDDCGRLAESVACRACGYDLHGVATDGVCPECGTEVRWSLTGDLLRFADPAWVSRLHRGLRMILILIAAAIPAGILILALDATLDTLGVRYTDEVTTIVAVIVWVTGLVLLIYGLWLATAKEPAVQDDKFSWRWLTRWGYLSMLAAVPLFILGVLLGELTNETAGVVVAGLTGVVMFILGVLGFVAMAYYARSMALRFPKPGLAKQTMWCLWSTLITYGGMVLLNILFFAIMFVGFASAMGVSTGSGAGGAAAAGAGGLAMVSMVGFMILSCVMQVATLGLFVWLIVILVLYMVNLKKAARLAEAASLTLVPSPSAS